MAKRQHKPLLCNGCLKDHPEEDSLLVTMYIFHDEPKHGQYRTVICKKCAKEPYWQYRVIETAPTRKPIEPKN
jgi:hypothetical protein